MKMILAAPLPSNELARVQSLRALNILDTQPDERFDSITRFATRGFNVPICLVSLVDTHRQWFKSAQGFDGIETPRKYSFCAHAILEAITHDQDSRIFEVCDTHRDIRFQENPLVQETPQIRAYLGYVLQSESKMNLGTLCIIDTKSREFTKGEKYLLMILGTMVENLINGNHYSTGIEYELN